jgi:hypothetical protein
MTLRWRPTCRHVTWVGVSLRTPTLPSTPSRRWFGFARKHPGVTPVLCAPYAHGFLRYAGHGDVGVRWRLLQPTARRAMSWVGVSLRTPTLPSTPSRRRFGFSCKHPGVTPVLCATYAHGFLRYAGHGDVGVRWRLLQPTARRAMSWVGVSLRTPTLPFTPSRRWLGFIRKTP